MLKFFSFFVFHVALMRLASSQFVRNAIVETSNGQIMGKMVNMLTISASLSVQEVWASIPGPVKSDTVSQRVTIDATFLRSCVVLALSCEDGSRHSLHASA